MKTILIVEDEADLREILSCNLETAGYAVAEAGSAEEALNYLATAVEVRPSLILLDVMMPGMNGFQMAEILRHERKDKTPIIFLTAKDREDDILMGFSRGGDDYITKPFSVKELMARVAAVLRRVENEDSDDSSNIINEAEIQKDETRRSLGDGLMIDYSRKLVIADGREIELSRKELGILETLSSQPGHIFAREDILSAVWKGESYVLDRTVDVHIARLRKKLGVHGDRISSRQGYGYKFE